GPAGGAPAGRRSCRPRGPAGSGGRSGRRGGGHWAWAAQGQGVSRPCGRGTGTFARASCGERQPELAALAGGDRLFPSPLAGEGSRTPRRGRGAGGGGGERPGPGGGVRGGGDPGPPPPTPDAGRPRGGRAVPEPPAAPATAATPGAPRRTPAPAGGTPRRRRA